jgi:cytochrome P450
MFVVDLPQDGVVPQFTDPNDASDFLHDPVGCMTRLGQHLGPVFALGTPRAPLALFVAHPEVNRAVFCNPEVFNIVSRFPGPKNTAQRRFGRGIFSLNGPEHVAHRRLLMPPFRKEMLAGYMPGLVALAENHLSNWRAGQTIDLIEEMKSFTLQMSAEMFFGVEHDALAGEIEGLFAEWLELNHVVSYSTLFNLPTPEGNYERLLDVAANLEKRLQDLIARRRAKPLSDDVLSCLLRARDQDTIGDAEVIGQTMNLFNAAYHTTTYALSWSMFLLTQHPSYLRRVIQEMAQGVHLHGPMPVLERGIKESLRLCSPVVYISRILHEAVSIGGVTFPAQTPVIVSICNTHRHAESYPNALRFDPDRWVDSALSPYAYVAFGGGARLCLGTAFSLMLMKIVLPRVFTRFRMQAVPECVIDREGTLTFGSRLGLPMQVMSREGPLRSSPVRGQIHQIVELPRVEAISSRAA